MKVLSVTISDSRAGEIEDALRSVEKYVDGCLLVDTGIHDDTIERARAVVGEKLVVVRHSWVDFSTARNAALDEAAKLGADWAVMLDTDERFVGDVRAAIESSSADVLLVGSSDGTYEKDKIFRLPSRARYVGPTHEVPTGGSRATASGIVFDELGKTREQLMAKYTRDAEILTAYTAQHPKDPRWWYYLGHTLEALGRADDALCAFARCSALRGWDEESAWACFRAAKIWLAKSRYEDVVEIAALGIARHPGIPELYWIAAVASYRRGESDKATYWAKLSIAASSLGAKRIGFRELPPCYELPYDVLRFSLPEEKPETRRPGERAFTPAFPNTRREAEEDFWWAKGRRYGACIELAAISRVVRAEFRGEARTDLGRLAKKLVATLHEIRTPDAEGWNRMNPCIFEIDGRLECVVRTVNYTIQPDGSYKTPAGVIETRNYLADVDSETLELSNVRPIVDRTGDEKRTTQICGFEDVRVVAVKGQRLANATVADRREDMRRQMALCRLEEDGSITHVDLFESDRHEKNWMPVSERTELIYSCDPTVVQERDSTFGRRETPEFALDHLRGGSQLVPVEDGFLAVTHEVIYLDNKRMYLHRFVRFDGDLRIESVSDAWYLEHLGIEFCAGMARRGADLIMSFGIEDRRAVFAVIALEDAVRMSGMWC